MEYVTVFYTEIIVLKVYLTSMNDASLIAHKFNDYISFIEKELEVPIKIVSVGPDRTQTIHR